MASFLLAILLQNSIPYFWNAWLIALFFLPIAFLVKYGLYKIKPLIGFKKWIRYFFIAIISLYWGYIAITLAYWYFLELKSNSIEKTLLNPIFIWIIIGFFILLEQVIFKQNKNIKKETISIFSDRKKTIIKIDALAYIESRGDFTLAILIDGSQYKNSIRISEWEQKLQGFLRVHRSFLVNPDFSTLKGNEVIVNAEWALPISRSCKQQVANYFKSKSI